jgi:sec-independent protein translocase protein TatA
MIGSLERLWPFIILIVVLIWGGPKLPGMAKNLAQSLKAFKKEIKDDESSNEDKKSDSSKE